MNFGQSWRAGRVRLLSRTRVGSTSTHGTVTRHLDGRELTLDESFSKPPASGEGQIALFTSDSEPAAIDQAARLVAVSFYSSRAVRRVANATAFPVS